MKVNEVPVNLKWVAKMKAHYNEFVNIAEGNNFLKALSPSQRYLTRLATK